MSEFQRGNDLHGGYGSITPWTTDNKPHVTVSDEQSDRSMPAAVARETGQELLGSVSAADRELGQALLEAADAADRLVSSGEVPDVE